MLACFAIAMAATPTLATIEERKYAPLNKQRFVN